MESCRESKSRHSHPPTLHLKKPATCQVMVICVAIGAMQPRSEFNSALFLVPLGNRRMNKGVYSVSIPEIAVLHKLKQVLRLSLVCMNVLIFMEDRVCLGTSYWDCSLAWGSVWQEGTVGHADVHSHSHHGLFVF